MALIAEAGPVTGRPAPPDRAPRPDRALIAVRGLTKRFGAAGPVLDRVDFDLGDGEAVALIGANGAGKSTLLRCCLRLVAFEAGEVRLLEQPVHSLSPAALRRLRARVGFVFQRHNLVPRLSVLTNVLHGSQARRGGPRSWYQCLARQEDREEALHCLEQVGLADLASQRADRLSGGQSQRVAIARALMQRPEIMFADEPVASLDPKAGNAVMELFTQLIGERGLSLLFTSHHLQHALTFSDRVVGLRKGRKDLDAPSRDQRPSELSSLYA